MRSADAIQIAVAEVGRAIGRIQSSSVRSGVRDGARVWIVVLEGDGKTAEVVVDAGSGDALSLEEVEGGD